MKRRMRLHDYQRTLLREKFLSALARRPLMTLPLAEVFCDESHVNKFNTYHDFAYMHISVTVKGFVATLYYISAFYVNNEPIKIPTVSTLIIQTFCTRTCILSRTPFFSENLLTIYWLTLIHWENKIINITKTITKIFQNYYKTVIVTTCTYSHCY